MPRPPETLSPAVLGAYARLTAGGAPPGADTLARAKVEAEGGPSTAQTGQEPSPPTWTPRDVLALHRAGLLDEREARELLGLPPRAPRPPVHVWDAWLARQTARPAGRPRR